MKSTLPGMAVLCFVLSLVGSGAVLAQSPPPGTPAVTPSITPAEIIPQVPKHWFSDYAKATSPIFAIDLDRRLERFEHETTNQFIVVIYPKMQSSAELGEYCTRVFNAWRFGRQGVNNGVILFVFMEDHQLRIEVGRGLEPVLTNSVCQEIANSTTPSFPGG